MLFPPVANSTLPVTEPFPPTCGRKSRGAKYVLFTEPPFLLSKQAFLFYKQTCFTCKKVQTLVPIPEPPAWSLDRTPSRTPALGHGSLTPPPRRPPKANLFVETLRRVALPALLATVVGCIYFDNLSLFLQSNLPQGLAPGQGRPSEGGRVSPGFETSNLSMEWPLLWASVLPRGGGNPAAGSSRLINLHSGLCGLEWGGGFRQFCPASSLVVLLPSFPDLRILKKALLLTPRLLRCSEGAPLATRWSTSCHNGHFFYKQGFVKADSLGGGGIPVTGSEPASNPFSSPCSALPPISLHLNRGPRKRGRQTGGRSPGWSSQQPIRPPESEPSPLPGKTTPPRSPRFVSEPKPKPQFHAFLLSRKDGGAAASVDNFPHLWHFSHSHSKLFHRPRPYLRPPPRFGSHTPVGTSRSSCKTSRRSSVSCSPSSPVTGAVTSEAGVAINGWTGTWDYVPGLRNPVSRRNGAPSTHWFHLNPSPKCRTPGFMFGPKFQGPQGELYI